MALNPWKTKTKCNKVSKPRSANGFRIVSPEIKYQAFFLKMKTELIVFNVIQQVSQ